MAEEILDDKVEQVEEEKKKGALGKLKDAILPDPEEQAAIISTFVRITVLAWSGGILTLNYVAIPGVPQQKIDPTFIASVFTGVLASFGIQTASKKGDGTMKMNGNGGGANGGPPPVTAKDIEAIIAKAGTGGPVQTIRVEQAPLKITTDDKPYKL
tara:strand:+ start:830 stop:1297 length:468 start_codon:yes stop_codon:yes gene_type:complete